MDYFLKNKILFLSWPQYRVIRKAFHRFIRENFLPEACDLVAEAIESKYPTLDSDSVDALQENPFVEEILAMNGGDREEEIDYWKDVGACEVTNFVYETEVGGGARIAIIYSKPDEFLKSLKKE